MTVALIDGDIAAYRAASVRDRGVDWGDGDTASSLVDPSAAADAACQTIDAWVRLAGCKDVIVTLTGRENFRKRILPTYKMNRAGKVKPPAYGHVVEMVKDRFPTRIVEGLEADDVMGILATSPKYHNAVVVTLDKDLRTVPGWHINPLKEDKPVLVGALEADHRWLMQALTGDTSDGYVGIPGVGPKKALAILGAVPYAAAALWPKVVAAYHKAKLTEEDALVQARVARILRRSDYDQTTKEIILWHMTTPLRIPLISPIVTPPEKP